MNWTKTIPTKPGAYWWKSQAGAIKAVEVFLDRYCNLIAQGLGVSDDVDLLGGEWCGPLVPVEEVQIAFEEGHLKGSAGMPASQRDKMLSAHHDFFNSRARRVVEGKEI